MTPIVRRSRTPITAAESGFAILWSHCIENERGRCVRDQAFTLVHVAPGRAPRATRLLDDTVDAAALAWIDRGWTIAYHRGDTLYALRDHVVTTIGDGCFPDLAWTGGVLGLGSTIHQREIDWRALDRSGRPMTAPLRINDVPGTAHYPTMVYADGTYTFAWVDDREQPSELYVAQVTDGTLREPPRRLRRPRADPAAELEWRVVEPARAELTLQPERDHVAMMQREGVPE